MALVGISYDPVSVLAEFAERRGIAYPLLSDEGSRVITELGLLDRDLVAHHERFGIRTQEHQLGVAYPAVFVLDADGRVGARRVGDNYRVREGALKLLQEAAGIEVTPAGPVRRSQGAHAELEVAADVEAYVRWQEMRLHVALAIEPGWHAYARPVPEGYVPLEVEVTGSAEVRVGEPAYPEGHPFRVEGLDEQFQVMNGRVEITVPFAVDVAAGHGPVTLGVGVRYQLSSDRECLPAAAARIEVRLEEAPPA